VIKKIAIAVVGVALLVGCGGGGSDAPTLKSVLTSEDVWYSIDIEKGISAESQFSATEWKLKNYDDTNFTSYVKDDVYPITFSQDENDFSLVTEDNETIVCSLGYYETGAKCVELACVYLDREEELNIGLFYNKEDAIKNEGDCFK